MNEHFIKNIEIKNFKCFEDFKAEGFGRVNLIGGKNNVGKTAFMEACYVNLSPSNVKELSTSLFSIKEMRENLNLLQILAQNTHDIKKLTIEYIESSKGISVNSNQNFIAFDIKEINSVKEYLFSIKKEKIKVNVNDYTFIYSASNNIEFIDSFGLSSTEIISNYSFIQKKDEELYLNKILNIFDSRIEAFKIIDEKPQCKISDGYLEITEFGDGVRHLISIVTSLYKCENGYLFIDELDNGIHYTMLDELWKVILEVSKKLNVQVFATTHSKEGIESYARVSKENKYEDITFIDMGRNRDNEIKAITMNYTRFQEEIEMDNEVRGW